MLNFKNAFELKVDNFIIRKIDLDDFENLFLICNNLEVCKYLTFNPFKRKEEAKITIQNMIRSYLMGKSINYAIVSLENNQLIGSISLTFNPKDDYAEIGYLLNYDYWNKKIMSKILKPFINYAFEYYGLTKMIAYSDVLNENSIKLLLKNDFILESNTKIIKKYKKKTLYLNKFVKKIVR